MRYSAILARSVTNRWIRFLLAVVAIAAASAAAFRIVQDEQRLAKDVSADRAADLAGETALVTLEQLQASLHAYVAPGQGLPFWTARSALLLDKLRRSLLDLDGAVTSYGGSIAEGHDLVDRLAAAEQRIRGYAKNEQFALAGDVIFGEARELIEGLRIRVAQTRDQISAAAGRRQADARREQLYLAGGAAGVLVLMLLLLVPPGRATTVIQPPQPAPVPVPARTVAPIPAMVPAAPSFGTSYANDLAALCADIAAAVNTRELQGLLERARKLLSARGVIVWISAANRLELHAAAFAGYEARMVSRLGPIHRDTGNLTADAFRENIVRSSSATGVNAAAFAVPLPAPDGPVGVFTAELSAGTNIDEAKLAAARVIAAQLGPLLGAVPSEAPDAASTPVANRASDG